MATQAARPGWAWHGRRVLAERRGTAILEFALVALPFLFLLCAIVEMGLIFVANYCLSNATLSLGRQLRVGSISAAGVSATSSQGSQLDLSDFKNQICQRMLLVPVATCLNQLQVDVRVQGSFSGSTAPNPSATTNFTTAGFCFYSGAQGSIVTLRTYYVWPLFFGSLFPFLSNASTVTTPSGQVSGAFYILSSSEIFKNEPNSGSSNNGSGC